MTDNDMHIIADRWMLESRQVINWGSYEGYHEFKPSMSDKMPVTLLAGASESGKSTLVDAQISLLYPTGTPYNKASNSGRSERNDYTYLRGMLGSSDSENGETPIYLRGRSEDNAPQAVWGAIVDTYLNRTTGAVLSCGKFLYLASGDGRGEVRRQYIAWNRKIDPRKMDRFRDTPFTATMLKKTYPECDSFPNAEGFHAYIWHEMGLSPEACRLLHKIQSADAPSRLDDIFKQGVLGVPEALELARTTVDDYERYDENFRSMEEKAKRIAKLRDIQNQYGEYTEALQARREFDAVNPDDEQGNATLGAWTYSRMAGEVRSGLPIAQRKCKEYERKLEAASRESSDLEIELNEVRDQISGIDDGSLARLEGDLERARRDAEETRKQRTSVQARFQQAGETMPNDEESWNAKRDAIAQALDSYDIDKAQRENQRDAMYDEVRDCRKERESLQADLNRQRNQKTRITQAMDEARAMLADAVGLDPKHLPYVAELMDVREDSEAWRVAMNVTYAPIAQTILVDKRYEQGFAKKVSGIDPRLMIRRTWQFVDTEASYDTASTKGWMSSKLRFKAGSPFTGWLREQVASERFDAKCVQTIDDDNRDERQVQTDGQLKSGAHGFHGIKNTHMIIGFVNERYLTELQRKLEKAVEQLAEATIRHERAKRQVDLLRDQKELANFISDMDWSKVDVVGAERAVEDIKTRIEEIRSNPELAKLTARRDGLLAQVNQANMAKAQAQVDVNSASHIVQAEQDWLDAYGKAEFDDSRLPSVLSNQLTDIYEATYGISSNVNRAEIITANVVGGSGVFADRVLHNMANEIRKRITSLNDQAGVMRANVETRMADYLGSYAPDDNMVTASVEEYRFYVEELKSLDMLSTRKATDEEYVNSLEKLRMSFMQIARAVDTDKKRIDEQLDRINAMLKGQQFGPRHGSLSISAEVHNPEHEFVGLMKNTIADLNDWKQSDQGNPAATRKQFERCRALVERLRQELGQVRDANGIKSYGAKNLDPRCRCSFYALVKHEDGPDERITSTGGRSGGALQELTSFIYGAALIYLLGGDVTGQPTYTTLFLDEALIKADGRYTQRALGVLPKLGFQVIVSAPESKTAEILEVATKAYVAYKDASNGRSYLQEITSDEITRLESEIAADMDGETGEGRTDGDAESGDGSDR
ncbi:ATP-binding protein [Bifidobacterium angulatum]|uniref:ATP-binding protein n=1 Tax=Bifidobacterium angulatum TaxID=1683 RepID=UPI003219D171